MQQPRPFASLKPAILLLTAAAAVAQTPAQADFFEAEIRPVLVNQCGSCHGEKTQMAGIRLTDREALHRSGVVAPGAPQASRLLQALRYDGEIKMPPSGKLSEDEIESFARWIADGAPWPETAAASSSSEPTGHWSLRPVEQPAPPDVADESWPRSPIDRFILAKLEQNDLPPSEDADPYTLLRRVTFDLTGLLPAPEEIDAFVNDDSPDAFEKVVDRLLASPDFGDRWGRHWLDLTYWADTTGVGRRIPLKESWRYRDYVINAFNQDKPFDRFVREQVAGPSDKDEPADDLAPAATGFLVIGPWAWFEMDRDQLRMDIVDRQIDLVGRTFLGLTIGCARCHDHKFDPIPTRDYYSLAGVFRSTRTISTDNMKGGLHREPLPLDAKAALRFAEEMDRWEKHLAEVEAADKQYAEREEDLKKQIEEIEGKPEEERDAAALEALKKDLDEVTGKRRYAPDRRILPFTEYMKPEPPHVYAAKDMEFPEDSHIAIRGDIDQPGDLVPRGFLTAVSFDEPPDISPSSSGRRELADWLTDKRNPLTARVYVNRIWHHLLGRGIVSTTDNFGIRGKEPTHPELLDYLASRLVENSWSTKQTIREIVLSRTYQMAGDSTPEGAAVDSDNLLLWRANRWRFQAEAIRDTILQVSGELDSGRGGPTLPLTARNLHTIAPYFLEEDTVIGEPVARRRTVYQPVMRGGQMTDIDILNLFDFADPNQVVGARATTTVPTQMLYLMNAPLLKDQARRLAERLLEDESLDDSARVDRLIRRTLSRPPVERDFQQASQFLSDFQAKLKTIENPPDDPALEAWARFCHAVLASSEFLYRR